MKCYLAGKYKRLGILGREAAIKQLVFSLVVSHFCQCFCLEVKGFPVTSSCFFCNFHNHLITGHRIHDYWMNDSCLGAFIHHPFTATTIYWLYSMQPTMLDGRGSGLGELISLFSGFSVVLGIFLHFMKTPFWGSGCIVTFWSYLRMKHERMSIEAHQEAFPQAFIPCIILTFSLQNSPWGYAMSAIFSLCKNNFYHHPKIAQHQLYTADFLASLENSFCGIGLFSNALQLLALESQLIQ